MIINILRSNSDVSYMEKHQIPFLAGKGDTVLSALLYIRQHLDSSLAFRYGCRFHRCGVCAVLVNGRPRLACKKRLKHNLRIEPLPGLPVIKDLIIDRRILWTVYKKMELYIPEENRGVLPQITAPALYYQLAGCNECLACLVNCPRFQEGEKDFWGPWLIARLALLHLDPRDNQDRLLQAYNLQIYRCANCRGCSCIAGLPLEKALDALIRR